MKAISVHVVEDDYRRFKSRAAVEKRPVAELIRDAMKLYLGRIERSDRSVLDIPAHDCGRMLREWDGSELFDEIPRGHFGSRGR